jgi:uncharacterized protein YdhG (YjbR/CyaY superfamily)
MIEKKKPAAKTTRKTAARRSSSSPFTDPEREAMRERAKEQKAARSRAQGADDEGDVLEKIAAMPAADRVMAERLHALVRSIAPELSPRLWYGMPAYTKNGAVLCFFQGAQKFKTRYATLGFSDKAALDDTEMWPTAFALTELTPAGEARIAELRRRAVG